MLTSFIRFAFISFLFSSAAVFSAGNVSNSTEPSAPQISPQSTSNTQIPEWFYRELSSIRKDVSVLDATGASKEQIQELKERIGKVEVRLEESQLRVDGKLSEQSGRIGDIHSFISQMGWLIGIVITIVTGLAAFFNITARSAAVNGAKEAANEKLVEWTQEKEAELTEKFGHKLTELSDRHEKEFQKIRDDAVIQSAETDINRALALAKDRSEEAIPIFDSVIKKFNSSDLVEHQRLVVDALYGKSFALDKPGFYKEQISLFDEIVENFNGVEDRKIQNRISNVLFNKGVILGAQSRPIEAVDVYKTLIERFQNSKDERIKNRVMKAMVNMKIKLALIGDIENKIRAYEDVVNRLTGSEDPDVQEQLINALLNKAKLTLVLQKKGVAKGAIEEGIVFMKDGFKEKRAIMEILNFIIDESTVSYVLSKIADIPESETIEWGFNEIRPVIENLEFPRKEQVEAFARFFEEHKDKAKLKEELDQISKL
ncbi:hypothetical protein SAMN02745753_01271 [Marinomonas polaris DSM 16579]|uniref:Uncharacterized protein n=1 Tax=Marinomonas polaris DSM 16579 TaxID=1122206 RepID=A0A1M4YNK2_9GAMM|nr:hypothetical protein [Marinomonas polaris]SHF07233.1 hypothetical protein SAMN02745753_01271 [Marinomonas polaris DSM 16579]